MKYLKLFNKNVYEFGSDISVCIETISGLLNIVRYITNTLGQVTVVT